jgi:acetyl esterase
MVAGMSPVHPQVQPLLDAMAAMDGPKLHEMSPTDARAMFEAMRTQPPESPDLASVTDGTIPSPDGHVIPIRTYLPTGVTNPGVCVYFHGGGWVIGSIESHDAPCREIAARSGCAVVSVDYRLSPETQHPGPLDDCVAATEWIAANGSELGVDGTKRVVAGDTAGGNLAAAGTLVARERQTPTIAAQVLVYPVTDLSMSTQSYVDNAEGYFLTADAMRWFIGHYCDGAVDDERVSPLKATDHANLPPALVLTAELDPLRDEGEAYAAELEAAGVPTTAHRYDGQIHGFLGLFPLLDDGKAALDEIANAIKVAIGS